MQSSGILHAKQAHDVVEISASATVTATGNGSAVYLPRPTSGIVFMLYMTDKDQAAGDTLDVQIETLITASIWVPVVHFTQQLGNGTNTEEYFAKICTGVTQAEFEVDTALGAAAVRHIIGDQWRASWVVVDGGGGTQSFTFSTQAVVI